MKILRVKGIKQHGTAGACLLCEQHELGLLRVNPAASNGILLSLLGAVCAHMCHADGRSSSLVDAVKLC